MMLRRSGRLATRLRPLAQKAAWAAATMLAAAPLAPAMATSLLMGTYPDKLLLLDETTGKVSSMIKLDTGLPTSLRMTNDKKKIFITTITTGGIEVMDAATKKIITHFSLNTPTTKYRFTGGVPDPTGRYYYTILMQIDKQPDRYHVSKWQYAVIDVAQKKVIKQVEIPDEDNPIYSARANFRISDDGKLLYLFREKVLVLSTADFKVVDKIDLAKPEGVGLQNVSFGGELELLGSSDEFVSAFIASDPYIHNKQFGIAHFKLSDKTFTYKPIGPAPYQMAGVQVSPDSKVGYTVVTEGMTGNKRCEFWKFDLTADTVTDKAEFPCRSRFNLGMSRDGKKLYIYGASSDIEVYDAATLKWEKTWNLEADATMAGLVYAQ